MTGEKNISASQQHEICINGRDRTTVSGVTEVISADNATVNLNTVMGRLIIKGTGLSMGKLDVSGGQLSLTGRINSIEYKDKNGAASSGLSKLFR